MSCTPLLIQSFNLQYADIVDEQLAESLSSYEKSFDDEVQRRSSAVRCVLANYLQRCVYLSN